jgi:hypothetical protein
MIDLHQTSTALSLLSGPSVPEKDRRKEDMQPIKLAFSEKP